MTRSPGAERATAALMVFIGAAELPVFASLAFPAA